MNKILMVAYTEYVTDARPRREAESFSRRGDEVHFYSLKEESRGKYEKINAVHLHRTLFSKYRGSNPFLYILEYARFFFRATIFAIRIRKKFKYNIIYIHTMPDIMAFVGLIPKYLGCKVILNVHDMMPEIYMTKFNITESHIIIRILKYQEKISIKFADLVICVHHLHKELLLKRTGTKKPILVLPNLPDPHIFKKDNVTKNTEVIILYHGTIAERSNVQLAVEAFSHVSARKPEVKLFIIGGGDYVEEIEKQIKTLKLTDKIYLTKKAVPVEEIPNYIKNASIGLVPYPHTIQMEYALPVKLLEYVYYEVPVITTKLKTIQYYFPENSLFYLSSIDVQMLSETMMYILDHLNIGKARAKIANVFFDRYSWDRAEEELFSFVDLS